MKLPQRGEIWIVDLGMAAKVRPVLVVSVVVLDQDRSIVTIVPHTTSVRGTRFEVPIKLRFLKERAFDCQNLITVPMAKFHNRLGTLTPDQMLQIETGVRAWLGL